jgi:dihydroneopterin aldolase
VERGHQEEPLQEVKEPTSPEEPHTPPLAMDQYSGYGMGPKACLVMTADTITLQNMAFYGYHGSDPHESKVGGRFYVDVVLHSDLSKPGKSDKLADTVNYERVYAIIRDHVEGKRFNLLEALGQTIADELLREFASVLRVEVRVRKPGVPLKGILDFTQVQVIRGR